MDTQKLVGLTEEAAVRKIKEAGFRARIRERDGEHFLGTCDLRSDRVNLYIKDGKVASASIG